MVKNSKVGFDNKLYLKYQTKRVKEKLKRFPDKLYLEFGGKLFDDYHAARILPGFQLDVKLKLLKELSKISEIIICINAGDIEKNKIRADYGITYDQEVLRMISILRKEGLEINSVIITLYTGQPGAEKFKNRLEELNIKTYIHTPTKGYPTDVDIIVSDEGYGKNPHIETKKPIVIVTAPGPKSGKLATCLSQLYHDYKKGIIAGYAKYETFPIWDLPLKHPLNMAYEAATADLSDINMIDSFHLEAYGIKAVNYNRDLEVFPILKNILYKITNENIYASPTDMGVNTISKCIINEKIIEEAAKQEIIRRYFIAYMDYKLGVNTFEPAKKVKILMNELNLSEEDRSVVIPARKKAHSRGAPSMALKLPNGKIVTGKQTELFTPVVSTIINALKVLTNIPDDVDLISNSILNPIIQLKPRTFPNQKRLTLPEIFIALSISSVTNPVIEKAMSKIHRLNQCDAHATYIIPNDELINLKNLGINVTCDPEFTVNQLELEELI